MVIGGLFEDSSCPPVEPVTRFGGWYRAGVGFRMDRLASQM